jgi:hypothetical protein
MKKKNDFKQKNTPPERDDHKEKRAEIPPVGDLQQEIREIRQAMINVRNLPVERRHPVPPEAIPDSIEELYRHLKKLETRLERLEQRVGANPYDPENTQKMIIWAFLGTAAVIVFSLLLSGC